MELADDHGFNVRIQIKPSKEDQKSGYECQMQFLLSMIFTSNVKSVESKWNVNTFERRLKTSTWSNKQAPCIITLRSKPATVKIGNKTWSSQEVHSFTVVPCSYNRKCFVQFPENELTVSHEHLVNIPQNGNLKALTFLKQPIKLAASERSKFRPYLKIWETSTTHSPAPHQHHCTCDGIHASFKILQLYFQSSKKILCKWITKIEL